MKTDELMLIDISGLAHQIFHVSGNEPDPSYISNQLVARVRAIASQHPHAAIACDSGKSFRRDIDPAYKAGRDTDNRAVLLHQLGVALDVLAKDGFPIWKVKGYEADDILCSAVGQALKIPDTTVVVVSDDKDLTQLISDRVTQRKFDGKLFTPADVFDKFGVKPEQIGDLLALMGDASDNIKGADKIGKVIGARLLSEHGSLAALYAKMDAGVVSGVTAGMRTSLMEFKERWPLVASLIALRSDVPEGDGFGFAEIAAERTAPPMEDSSMSGDEDHGTNDDMIGHFAATVITGGDGKVPFEQGNDANDRPLFEPATPTQTVAAPLPLKAPEPTKAAPMPDPRPAQRIEPKATDIAVPQPPAPIAPVDFSQQLEPRNIDEAKMLAKYAFASRMFSAYGTEQAVLMVLMAGRELGMTAMASLRGFHLVEGRATLSADLIRALIIRSGKAKYFRPTERTATRATWETQRGDDPPVSLSFTIEEAQQAGVVKNGSGWTKYPADMLTARASAKLARLVYSDIVFNLYDPSEIG